jgi:rhodanese-related sulfurtransferase
MPVPKTHPPEAEQLRGRTLWKSVLTQTAVLTTASCLLSYGIIRWELEWPPPGSVRKLHVKEARARQTDFVWVDVRNSERFESAHIPGAIHFNEADSKASLDAVRRAWKANKKLGVYGEGTGSERAQRVAVLLKAQLATREIYLLEGGWASWPMP